MEEWFQNLALSEALKARLRKFADRPELVSLLRRLASEGDRERKIPAEREIENLLTHVLEFEEQDWVQDRLREFEQLSAAEQADILRDAHRR